jgi:hypothetical protein
MIIDFKGLLDSLENDEIFTIANEARPGSNYLFNFVLPERKMRGYSAKVSSMTVKSTMSKLVGMDSPYPRGGVTTRQSFDHELAKMAIEMPFPEQYLRQLREIVNDVYRNNEDDQQTILETMFNFTDKLLVQPHLDTAEWLRAQALIYGEIDWQSDDIHLEVDYGIPAANFLTARTGNDGYGGSTSKFWTDWHEAQRILKNKVRAVYMNTRTLQTIMYNSVNNLRVVRQDELAGVFQFQRYVTLNGVNVVSDDVRDNITIFVYDDEGEVLDETQPGTGETVSVPFVPDGAIVAIGAYDSKQFRIGAGSTAENINNPVQLGYTHVGPTEEGNGRLGRWANTFVPQGREWMFVGQSVQNLLPVIEAPDRIVNLTTDVV